MGIHNMANCHNDKIAVGQVLLSSAIDSKVGLAFCREIEKMSQKGFRRIRIGVNSPGGNVRIALGVYKFIRSLPLEIETYNVLRVDSAAILIYLSGMRRYVAPSSTFALHRIFKMMSEPMTADGFRAAAREIERDERIVASHLAKRTSLRSREWIEKMVQGTTLNAKESIDFGLAHLAGDFDCKVSAKVANVII